MDKYTLFSKHVSLGVVAHLTRKWGIWETIGEYVQIAQKTVKHTPLEKVEDAWINILAGGRGVVEINTRLRSDKGLGRLFGRRASAEQSTVAETLTACTAQNVEQMQCAYTVLFRRLSQTYRHDYQTELLVDVDLTGLPCGRGAEKAEKGYFAGKKIGADAK